MADEELEIYNPANSDEHKLGTIFSKEELKKLGIVHLFFVFFTVIVYFHYSQNPGCPQSDSSNQCWDIRAFLLPIGMMGILSSLILILFSLFRYSRKKE